MKKRVPGETGFLRKAAEIVFFVCLMYLVGCGRTETTKYPERGLANLVIPNDTQDTAEFNAALNSFFELLRQKDWGAIYDWRTADFRSDVSRETFLEMGRKLKSWSLVHYEVLHAEFHPDMGVGILVCSWVEEPGMGTNYSWMVWVKEEGQWRCAHGGPVGPRTMLSATRWVFSFPRK